jgi:hypothetical protein
MNGSAIAAFSLKVLEELGDGLKSQLWRRARTDKSVVACAVGDGRDILDADSIFLFPKKIATA